MQEPIELLFQYAGLDLVFSSFTVKGIPGISLQTLMTGMTTVYETQREDVDIRISTTDAETYNAFIIRGALFYILDMITEKRYDFKVIEAPVPDFTGISTMKVTRIL